MEDNEIINRHLAIDFANWIIKQGYKYVQMNYSENNGVWFLDKKSIGITSDEL